MTVSARHLSPESEVVASVLKIVDADGSHFANSSPRYTGTI
jgi:hypothetical protein